MKIIEIPSTIIQLQKYFSRNRPKKKDGLVFTNFKLTYNKEIEDIIINLKYALA